MNTNLLNIVKGIIANNGETVLADPKRLKAFLSYLAKDEPKPLRSAFCRCVESGAYAALKTALGSDDRAKRKTAIAQRLCDVYGLDTTPTREALDILEAAIFGTMPTRRKKNRETRSDESIVQIKESFQGAIRNLCLLKDKLIEIENIHLYQYSNYLLQIALCIELGFKSMIVNANDFECTHDLEALFSMTPEVFQQKFKSMFSDDNTVKDNLTKMKDIFVDFRYMKRGNIFNEFLDTTIINNDTTININEAAKLFNFQFLFKLLEETIEYEKFYTTENARRMENIDLSDPDSNIRQFTELLKTNQPNVVLVPKQQPKENTP
jgi:hypothetical protein